MSVVAEGVETEEKLMLLRALGCEYGQGYYLAKPMEAQAGISMGTAHDEMRHLKTPSLCSVRYCSPRQPEEGVSWGDGEGKG